MLLSKNIIVVAPDVYKDLARRLSHEISKLPGCEGTFWNIKHYEQNEHTLSGKQLLILMGNSEENPITRDLFEEIKNLQRRAGACFGFDGTKAVVYGEGKLEQAAALKAVLKKAEAIKEEAVILRPDTQILGPGAGILLAATLITIPVGLIWSVAGSPIVNLAKKISSAWRRHAQERELRKEQTRIALTLFLAECFEEWAGIK